ncbi:uncharacterized protein LOC114853082 [Betta splendens]|uniref:Uncharacterized protein LOC114853082 n=1 Tax=Betta splendens TaxID=158456 RepID=A0A6P7M6N2_BETSP|nr:uncharacterized protein LOC114853082 [Betta splendens]
MSLVLKDFTVCPQKDNLMSEEEDCPQTERRTLHPLTLLKDDLLKAFKTQHEALKPEKRVDHLSLFKDDLNHFKDDLSNLFRFGLSVEKEKKKDSKIAVVTDGDNSKCLRKEEQLDWGFRETLSQQNKDSGTGDGLNQPELIGLGPNSSEPTQERLNPGRTTCISCQTTGFNYLDHAGSNPSLTGELDNCSSNFHQKEDKDTDNGMKDQKRTETPGDDPSTQTEEKPCISVLKLLKEDVSFSLSRDGTDQPAETSLSCLSQKRQEHFTFKRTKQKDEEDKIEVLKSERKDDPLKNLFKKDQNTGITLANRGEVLTERKEEQPLCGFKQSLSELDKDKTERSNNNKSRRNEAKDSVPDTSTPQDNSGICDMMDASSRAPGLFKALFRREQMPVMTPDEADTSQRVHSEEQLDRPPTQTPSQQNRYNNQTNPNASEAGFPQTPQAGRMMSRTKTAVAVEAPSLDNNHRDSENQGGMTISSLTLLKEDFHHFRNDLLSVFRFGLSKDKDNKEDSSKAQKLVGRNGKLDFGHRINFPEQNKETFITETRNHAMTDTTDPSDPELSHRVRFPVADEPKVATDVGPSPGVSLFSPRRNAMGSQLGEDLWSPKNFATYLTFDPNTANSELHLSDGNRRATRMWSDQRPSDHPERFLHCPQVLCREGLLDSVYWEAEWSGGADIGLAYNSISRDGDTKRCLLGHNTQSWSLECSEGSYTPSYNGRRLRSVSPQPFTRRVGVHLDWSAGTLSFYCVSQDAMVLLHTFTSTFTEPLYAAFWIWAYEGSVLLRQVELAWERLQ